MEKAYASFLSLLNSANVVGHSGKAYNFEKKPIDLSEDEICYSMFLYDIDMQLLDRKKNWGFDLDKKTRLLPANEVEQAIDERIRQITEYYNKTYASQDFENMSSVCLLHEDKLGVGVYTLQHILRLNGYEIDTDKSIKELNDELSCSAGDSYLPIRKSKEKLDINSIILSMCFKGVQGNPSCALLYKDAMERDRQDRLMNREGK